MKIDGNCLISLIRVNNFTCQKGGSLYLKNHGKIYKNIFNIFIPYKYFNLYADLNIIYKNISFNIFLNFIIFDNFIFETENIQND